MNKVEVIWLDAMSDDGLIPIEQARKMLPAERSNVGYLLFQDNDRVVIAFGMMGTDVDERMVFPACMVKAINPLRDDSSK
jgi:hypothetical protein